MMEKKCRSCGSLVDLRKHHIFSHKLAKIIVMRQFKEKGHGVGHAMQLLRKRSGDLLLCKTCHRNADDSQERMVKILENVDIYAGKTRLIPKNEPLSEKTERGIVERIKEFVGVGGGL